MSGKRFHRLTLVTAAMLALTARPATYAAESAPGADELSSMSIPVRVLIDNDKVRVNLVEFPRGYVRPGHFHRRTDQILVFLDDGGCSAAAQQGEHFAAATVRARGSAYWLPDRADAAPLRTTEAFRALYIELKHGTMSAPDPAAVRLPPEPAAGGGAPTRVLIDNEQVRATLISFPEGFIRPGGFKRRLDTLIVYIDDAKLELPGPAQRQYAVIRSLNHSSAIAVCDPIKDCDSVAPDGHWATGGTLVRGTVAWHPQGGFVNKLRIAHGYRAIYLELKH